MVDDTNVIAAPKAACIPNICEVFSFLSTKPKSKPDNKILSSDEYSKRKLSWKQQPEAVTVVTTDDVTSCSSLKVESEGIQEFYSTNQEEDNSNMNGFHNFGFNINNDFHREGHSPHGMFFRDRSRRATDSFSHFTSVPSPLSKSASRRSKTPTSPSLFRNMSGRGMNGSDSSPMASMSRNSSRRSSTPIMFSNSTEMMMKPPPIEKRLECTLEELCYGCMKKIKVTRDVLTNTGHIVQEEELLTIKVKPGWKKGTKITFEGIGNERPGMYAADITFVIAEKRHALFRRVGDDLELAVEIPLVKALTGCKISVPLLGGEKLDLKVKDIIYPGYEKIIEGQGMPNPKDQGKRGNLRVMFLVEFPMELADEQRSEVVRILRESDE
ncbi:protein psi1-like [Punica granatum]|uniref:Protein psi1-like n=2 Tax=Punica granatum TaxID=22663 RepID=A0A6P8BY17_PUNGR|nr:protein psi1-like [Punica granatum]